ncbi:MAG: SWIM zinc finger family protein [Janthinobacterium lividum]
MSFDPAGLTDAALEAASSKGLLRRAGGDRDAGLVTAVADDADGTVLTVDGETVRVGPGGLAGARCTCPAPGLCRHILAGLLVLRDASSADARPAADPVAEIVALDAAALVQAFGRPALKRAEAILAAASVAPDGGVTVTGGTVQIAGHPAVHYVPGSGPPGMVSKSGNAAETKALHAAALLAIRRRAAGEAVARTVQDAPAPARSREPAFLDDVADALREAARFALTSAPLAIEERLLDLAVSSRADALPNLAAALQLVATDMTDRRTRALDFDPADALAAIARGYALAGALRGADDPGLRSQIRETYEPVATLDAIGCGVRFWQSETGARGATAYLLALGADSGPRWLTVTLARAAGQDPAFQPEHAALHEAVWGQTLDRLGRGAVRLDNARISPDGRVAPGPSTRATLRDTSWRKAMAALPGTILTDWSAIAAHVLPAFRPSLRQAPGRVRPVLLDPRSVGPLQFDAVTQTAWLPVQDQDGAWLGLVIENGPQTDTHLAALEGLSAGPAPLIVALVRVEVDRLVLSPIALVREGVLTHLDVPLQPAPAPATKPGASIMDRLSRILTARMVSRRTRREPSRFIPLAPSQHNTARILAEAADETLALAELGGRMEDVDRLTRLRGLAQQLDTAGLAVLGMPLARLAEASATDRPHHLLVFTYALACFRQLSPSLPLVTRVA